MAEIPGLLKWPSSMRLGAGPAHTVAHSTEESGFFINWADFASVEILESDLLVAHWLVRGLVATAPGPNNAPQRRSDLGPDGGYDYGIRVARSTDGGLMWTEPWTPHMDGTRTEHGFVSRFPLDGGGIGLVWLDARDSVDRGGEKGTPGAMALRYRFLDRDGVPGLESLAPRRTCLRLLSDGRGHLSLRPGCGLSGSVRGGSARHIYNPSC